MSRNRQPEQAQLQDHPSWPLLITSSPPPHLILILISPANSPGTALPLFTPPLHTSSPLMTLSSTEQVAMTCGAMCPHLPIRPNSDRISPRTILMTLDWRVNSRREDQGSTAYLARPVKCYVVDPQARIQELQHASELGSSSRHPNMSPLVFSHLSIPTNPPPGPSASSFPSWAVYPRTSSPEELVQAHHPPAVPVFSESSFISGKESKAKADHDA